MEQNLQTRPLGLYLHIPWCLSHCRYCNFFTLKYGRKAAEAYYRLLLSEKELYLAHGFKELSTIYFGGGTPSLLSAEQISELIAGLPLTPDVEITLELNPIQISPDFLQKLSSTPINRLSLGLQSMLEHELSYLDRQHKASDIPAKIKLLREFGYKNISADLIYGLPDSTLESVKQNLNLFLALPLEHISCYLLEIHDDSELIQDRKRIPSDELLAVQYHTIRRTIQTAGFEQYEISNFARPGYQSRHNLLYWQGDDYLAWGASACGYFQGLRYQNPADLDSYQAMLESGKIFGRADPQADAEADYIMMALRLLQGMDLATFKSRFGHDFVQGREVKLAQLSKLGLIEPQAGHIRLTPQALFISNAVIAELL